MNKKNRTKKAAGAVSLSVPLPEETHRKLMELAERDGRPKANMARVLIEEGIERRTTVAA